jgi:hypothetical protein
MLLCAWGCQTVHILLHGTATLVAIDDVEGLMMRLRALWLVELCKLDMQGSGAVQERRKCG